MLHGRMKRVEQPGISMWLNQAVCCITGKLICSVYRNLRVELEAYRGEDQAKGLFGYNDASRLPRVRMAKDLPLSRTPGTFSCSWRKRLGEEESLSKVQRISSLFRCDIDVPSWKIGISNDLEPIEVLAAGFRVFVVDRGIVNG